MIARTWHGVTPASMADGYLEHLNRTGIPDYHALPGNRGVYVLRRTEGDHAHLLLMSLWKSLDAIAAFADADTERARYYSGDARFLLELESAVTHYEVLVQP